VISKLFTGGGNNDYLAKKPKGFLPSYHHNRPVKMNAGLLLPKKAQKNGCICSSLTADIPRLNERHA